MFSHDSIRHYRARRALQETTLIPTRPNPKFEYPTHAQDTIDTTRTTTASQSTRPLMYKTQHTTNNTNNDSTQRLDLDLGFDLNAYISNNQVDHLFETSNYPAQWGMQFQGNNSKSVVGGGNSNAIHQQQQQFGSGNDDGRAFQQHQQQRLQREGGAYGKTPSHTRNVSESSINSVGPSSPYATSNYSNPYIVNHEHSPRSPLSFFDEASSGFHKQTPRQDLDLDHDQFQSYSSLGYVPSTLSHTPAVHLDMKHMAMDQHNATADDMPDFSHSSRQSVSSKGRDSPSTPDMDNATTDKVEETSEERPALYKISSNDYRQGAPRVELFRTESAAAADELYNPGYSQPTTMPATSSAASASSTSSSAPNHLQAQAPPASDANYLSPNRTLVQDRIRTANSIRSQSPQHSTFQRDKSPFRPGSPLAPPDGAKSDNFKSPSAFFASAADARRQQIEEASAREVDRHYKKPTLQREPTKTMSPRDALLDYNDTDDMPLFPETLPAGYANHVGGSEYFTNNFVNGAAQAFDTSANTNSSNLGGFRPHSGAYDNMNVSNASATDNSSSTTAGAPAVPTELANFLPPQQQQRQQQPQQQQQAAASQIPANPYTAPHYRPANSYLSADQTPDFPAHLTSMESSVSDVPMSSQGSAVSDVMMQRPQDTSAATGGYTCTFHNCTQRFDTPAKLQKHKREIHHTNHQRDVSASLSSAPPTTAPHSAHSSISPDPSHDGSEGSGGSVGSGMTSAALAARNSQSGPHKCTRINPSTGKPCNTIFSRPYDLTRHEDTIHNRQKVKVRCQYCREEKTFSRNDALTRHMRVVHPEIQWDVKRGSRGASVRSDFL